MPLSLGAADIATSIAGLPAACMVMVRPVLAGEAECAVEDEDCRRIGRHLFATRTRPRHLMSSPSPLFPAPCCTSPPLHLLGAAPSFCALVGTEINLNSMNWRLDFQLD